VSTAFLEQIRRNPINAALLDRWSQLMLPNAWLVAGCLFQTVWNLQSGRPAAEGLRDCDLFYFDPDRLDEASEREAQAHADAVFGDLGIPVEVANQARVHCWYPAYFGRPCPPLQSTEDGIRRFLVLETCVGVQPDAVCAPYGLDGLAAGTLSPNPLTPYPELFARKVESYRARWPWLKGSP
jgi:hypothetical protein